MSRSPREAFPLGRARIVLVLTALLCLAALGGTALAAGAAPAGSSAEGPPPPPRAANGQRVDVLARGVPTPTVFAFGKGTIFVGAAGSEDGKQKGGVFVVRGGAATPIPGLPPVSGLAWKNGTLYGTLLGNSARLFAWSGWNGSRFAKTRLLYKGPRKAPGLNGIAFGGNGRLYVGVGLTEKGDHKLVGVPYETDLLSMRADGRDVKVVAKGFRQPWQLTFVKGIANPFVTVLAQENLGKKKPPDFIARVKDGDDYGFPTCNWSRGSACSSYTKPFALFPAHSSPTGIAAIRSTLYVGFFGGRGKGPEVARLSAKGGAPKSFLSGFVAPVVGVGASGGYVYCGDLTGSIYRVKA